MLKSMLFYIQKLITPKKININETIFIPSNMFSSLKNDFRIVLTQKKSTDLKKVSFITYKPGVSNFVVVNL